MSEVGRRIGRYLLVDCLGRGGMGEVYLAHLTGTGGFVREVALKLILPDLAAVPRFVELFLREGRALASLHHRNVVQVYELDSVDGRLYMAMEYLRGVNLAALRSASRTLRWPAAAYIGAEIARGLAASHELRRADAPAGLVHGDLSPSNVMACFDGAVKLLDFGVARPAGVEPTSHVPGKLPYLPPESVMGAPLDARADVYALGVVLYELLTSTPLFRGTNDLDTMNRVLTAPVAAPSSLADVPPVLDDITLRAMARDRGARFATARELADAIDDVVGGRFTAQDLASLIEPAMGRNERSAAPRARPAPPTPKRRSFRSARRAGVLAFAVIASALGIALVSIGPRPAEPNDSARRPPIVTPAAAASPPALSGPPPIPTAAPAQSTATTPVGRHDKKPTVRPRRRRTERTPRATTERGIAPGFLADPFARQPSRGVEPGRSR